MSRHGSTTDEVLAAARDLVQAFGRHDTAAYFDCFAPSADGSVAAWTRTNSKTSRTCAGRGI